MAALPRVVILEQPTSRHRFRYASEVGEGRTVGSLHGAGSTPARRTFPTIAVPGYHGPMVVVLSLVSPNDYLVHPHSVTGTDRRYHCNRGVVCLFADGPEVAFNNVGIICVKRKSAKAIEDAIRDRQEARIDPFGEGFAHMTDHRLIDFSAVRLCFQVYLPGPRYAPARRRDVRAYSCALAPALSAVVQNTATLGELKIVRLSQFAGSVMGGTEMIILCEKYSGANPEVVFEAEGWEARAPVELHHKQFAIVFRTPRYHDLDATRPVEVEVFLQRLAAGGGVERSAPAAAELLPLPPRAPPRDACLKRPPPDYLATKAKKPTLAQRCARARAAAAAAAASAASSQAVQPSELPYHAVHLATPFPNPSYDACATSIAREHYAPNVTPNITDLSLCYPYQLNPFHTNINKPSTSANTDPLFNFVPISNMESVVLHTDGPLPNVVPTAPLLADTELPPDLLAMSPDVSNQGYNDNIDDYLKVDDIDPNLEDLLCIIDQEMLSDELKKLCCE